MKVKVYLKSGQVMEFESTKINLERDYQGNLTKITWDKVESGINLFYLDLNEVVGITTEM
ncbi:hypothetical protein D3C76_221960 [compost metagenome]